MPIELEKEEEARLRSSLQRYFREELEQELGELRAQLLVAYLLREVAPFAYNRGVRDAEAYFRAKAEDLAGSCFEPELTYWASRRGAGQPPQPPR
jgi:uncharacterized protein (DUF2164 family)